MPNDEPIAIYTKPSLQLWGWVASGAILAGLVVYDLLRFSDRPREVVVHAMFFMISLACFLAAHATAKWKVTFYDDRVEWSGAFHRMRRLLANDIAGFRRTGWGSMWLVPKCGRGAILVPSDALADEVPLLEVLADLDAVERDAMRNTALSKPRFGVTPAAREAFVAHLPNRLRWLNWAGWLSIAWTILWPYPRELLLAVLIAAPVITIALMIWARPLVNIDDTRDMPGEISLFAFMTWPSLMLGVRGLLDYEHLSFGAMFLTAVACALPLVVVIAWCDPPTRRRSASLAGATLACLFLGVGGVIHANTLLDTSPIERFVTTVVKAPGTGRYKTEIDVAPWGDKKEKNKIKTTTALADTLEAGDRICIDVHPGALGLRWYEVARCK